MIIQCPYCQTEFEHSGRVELQHCPGCGTQLICGNIAASIETGMSRFLKGVRNAFRTQQRGITW